MLKKFGEFPFPLGASKQSDSVAALGGSRFAGLVSNFGFDYGEEIILRDFPVNPSSIILHSGYSNLQYARTANDKPRIDIDGASFDVERGNALLADIVRSYFPRSYRPYLMCEEMYGSDDPVGIGRRLWDGRLYVPAIDSSYSSTRVLLATAFEAIAKKSSEKFPVFREELLSFREPTLLEIPRSLFFYGFTPRSRRAARRVMPGQAFDKYEEAYSEFSQYIYDEDGLSKDKSNGLLEKDKKLRGAFRLIVHPNRCPPGTYIYVQGKSRRDILRRFGKLLHPFYPKASLAERLGQD